MYSFMHIIFKTNLCSDNLDRQKKVNLEAVKQFPFFFVARAFAICVPCCIFSWLHYKSVRMCDTLISDQISPKVL